MYSRASCHSVAIFTICYFLLIMFHGYEKVFEDPFDNWDFCRWYCLFFMLLRFMGELYVQSRQHYLLDDENDPNPTLLTMLGNSGYIQMQAYNRQKSLLKIT
jgi:hypothetical protein